MKNKNPATISRIQTHDRDLVSQQRLYANDTQSKKIHAEPYISLRIRVIRKAGISTKTLQADIAIRQSTIVDDKIDPKLLGGPRRLVDGPALTEQKSKSSEKAWMNGLLQKKTNSFIVISSNG